MNPLTARYRRWQKRRALDRHAKGIGEALLLISHTNPTLASVTWKRIDERMADLLKDKATTNRAFLAALDDVALLASTAVDTEVSRLARRT